MAVSRSADIVAALKDHAADLRRFGVNELFLFGSFVRDEAGPQSDIDFLVDFEGSPTFDDYMDLKFFLEDLLERPVDLATRESLRPRLRSYVEEEARRVA